jgi:hypothetical protein
VAVRDQPLLAGRLLCYHRDLFDDRQTESK